MFKFPRSKLILLVSVFLFLLLVISIGLPSSQTNALPEGENANSVATPAEECGYDVNSDEQISPLDALQIINELRRDSRSNSNSNYNQRFDVNKDNRVSALDALTVINFIRRSGAGSLSQYSCGPQTTRTRHKKCNSEALCLYVEEAGEDECNRNTDCMHRECNDNGSCGLALGPGPNNCENNFECRNINRIEHKECDPNDGFCKYVEGAGRDQCENHSECGWKQCNSEGLCTYQSYTNANPICEDDNQCGRKQCANGLCFQQAFGNGPSCENDNQCSPKQCNNEGYCTNQAPGRGRACSADSECGFSTCDRGACRRYSGTAPTGTITCEDDSHCWTRKYCDFSGACVLQPARSPAQNDQLCENDSNCGYKDCTSYGICQQRAGKGTDKCSNNSQCFHNECDQSTDRCIVKTGPGPDQCEYDSECRDTITPRHKECSEDQTCELVDGAGEDHCVGDLDCRPGGASHKVCFHNRCIVNYWQGDNECFDNFDCGGTEGNTYKTCVAQLCLIQNGVGVSTCSTHEDCVDEPTRKYCENDHCLIGVPDFSETECETHEDCREQPRTHKACRLRQCIVVDGPGANECRADIECSHKTCVAQGTCRLINGPGDDECINHEDCNECDDCGHEDEEVRGAVRAGTGAVAGAVEGGTGKFGKQDLKMLEP